MTRDEFKDAAAALVGPRFGWQSRLARYLDVNPRTVQRAASKGPSDTFAGVMLAAVSKISLEAVPAKFIIGAGDDGGRYLVHTKHPRFICQVADGLLCAVHRIDPTPADITSLMDDAAGFVAATGARIERRMI